MHYFVQLNHLPLEIVTDSLEWTDGGAILSGQEVKLQGSFDPIRFYRHGFHSWSLTRWMPLDSPIEPPLIKDLWPQMDDSRLFEDYPSSSSGVGAMEFSDQQVLLLGALDLEAQVVADKRSLVGRCMSSQDRQGRPPPSNHPCRWFMAYGTEAQVFSLYAGLLKGCFGRRSERRPPRVWCSWYSLYGMIDEDTLLEALRGWRGMPFDFFQIDDGWQSAIGDWHPNPKFPSGMEYIAEQIHNEGYRAGIWLSPFIVQPASDIYRKHTDWLLCDERGNPIPAGHNWGDVFYALDVTHPDVQEWLAHLIYEVRGWGYDYLKLDFLYAAALQGRRYQDMGAESTYRRGLEVLNQAAGNAYLLACGAPIFASLGLVDGVRIGPDVAPYWAIPSRFARLHDYSAPSSQNALRTAIHRLWLRDLVHIDPDIVFFRTRYNLLSPREKQFLIWLAQISGFRATSDLPDWLDWDEQQALHAFLSSSPTIQRIDRYRFNIDGLEINFSSAVG